MVNKGCVAQSVTSVGNWRIMLLSLWQRILSWVISPRGFWDLTNSRINQSLSASYFRGKAIIIFLKFSLLIKGQGQLQSQWKALVWRVPMPCDGRTSRARRQPLLLLRQHQTTVPGTLPPANYSWSWELVIGTAWLTDHLVDSRNFIVCSNF